MACAAKEGRNGHWGWTKSGGPDHRHVCHVDKLAVGATEKEFSTGK